MVLSSFRRPQWRSRRWNARHDKNSELRTKLFKMKSARITAISVYLALFLSVTYPNIASGYSVLTHEAIVDAAWNISIRPILLQRFPNATTEELKTAHGYAYGGAIIQDLGYYPHGSHFFTDLTHYCRTGDFVLALLRDSQDLNGYSFAIGALAHYAADNDGHRLGINPSVPIPVSYTHLTLPTICSV